VKKVLGINFNEKEKYGTPYYSLGKLDLTNPNVINNST